jgi:imidazolonepropionase-like amidohydrolase
MRWTIRLVRGVVTRAVASVRGVEFPRSETYADTVTRILAIALAATVLVAAYTHQPAARYVIRAAKVIDPTAGTTATRMIVLVRGSRIEDVIPADRYARAPGDSVIDLGDATLMPGMIDGHVHLTIGGPPRTTADADLRAGFTTVADLGARSMRVLQLRDSIAAGAVQGPRVLAAGLWIGVKGGVCEFGGIGVAGGVDAFRARVRENLSAGADLIKVCITGWPAVAWSHPDSAELRGEILGAMVDETHRANGRVVAHSLSRAGVSEALDRGVDGLVHAAYVDDALAARMARQGMWMIPTLASLTGGDTSAVSRGLIDGVRRAHRGGVKLVYGTDGGVLPHGENAKEAAALVAAGIPPLDVLRAATTNAAAAFGIADSVGVIRRGMVADIVAVNGDPLADIAAFGRPVFVMARGRVITR